MLYRLSLGKETEPGFSTGEGLQYGAPLCYTRPGVTFGDLEKDVGGRNHCSYGSGPRWHPTVLSISCFLSQQGNSSDLPGSLSGVNLQRSLWSGHPLILLSTMMPLPTFQIMGEHLPAHAFPRRV